MFRIWFKSTFGQTCNVKSEDRSKETHLPSPAFLRGLDQLSTNEARAIRHRLRVRLGAMSRVCLGAISLALCKRLGGSTPRGLGGTASKRWKKDTARHLTLLLFSVPRPGHPAQLKTLQAALRAFKAERVQLSITSKI